MNQKKIFIDGLGLIENHFSGVGQYILGICRGLDDLLEEGKNKGQPVPQIFIIIPRGSLTKFNEFGFKHIGHRTLPTSFRITSALWYRSKMPPLDIWFGRGFYLFPRFVTMPLLFSKSAVTIFDLSYELYRQYSDEKNAIFLSKGVKESLRKVEHVFTISENAKKEIIDFYKLPKNKISVATPAADQRYFYRRSVQEIEKVKAKYGIEKNYILALSNLEPRKNLDTLVDAYCALPKKYRDQNALLLVGVNGWKTDKLFKKIIDKVEAGYNIIRPNSYVSDADKPAIISGAKILVYPSHYEGFGMPPLEALACGVPVITANNSSLPEVVGLAGKMLKCDDVKGFTKSITDYLNTIDKITKKSTIEGPTQASKFSWQKSAQIYWDYIMDNK